MDGGSDEQLMAQIAQGSEQAFRMLAGRYARRGVGFARRVLGSEVDAEDVVQEALLRVWVNAARWRPTAAFRTWFYRVLLNLCLNRKRRAPFANLADVAEAADPGLDPGQSLELREMDRSVADAIASLPERQRAAILLTYEEDLSNADTAVVLGTSVSGVETLLVRARRALRRKLGATAVRPVN
jgi:RNA polymerase sigma-70 factor, ECF subfamily